MKKALCILLFILLLVGCTGCVSKLSLPSESAVRICYDRGDVSFDLELSQEEASIVVSVLNGKKSDLDLAETGAACGFGREQAFIIHDRVYCLAQDSCNVLWKEGTQNYYVVSNQELEELKAIFKAHGAVII